LIAFESQLTLETVANTVAKVGGFASGKPDQILDALFIIDRGYAIDLGNGSGSFKFVPPEGNQSGWIAVEDGDVLFTLMTWLSITMPRVVRFGPLLPLYLLEMQKESPKVIV
jgi:hypothetical protein